MCRHLVYLGPAVPLAELLLDPPHALYRQSWAPVDMRSGGTVNADGFGVGWYPLRPPKASNPDSPSADAADSEHPEAWRGIHSSDAMTEPVRYRRGTPIWSDETLPTLLRATVSGAVLAAVRSATVGMPVTEAASAPFADGRWLFSHNGRITGWPDSVAELAAGLPVTDLLTMDAPTDAAFLWALVRHRLRAGAAMADTLAAVVREVAKAAPGSRLNLLLTDGESVAATTLTHALSVRRTDESVAVSSEPWDLDDRAWKPVPDRHLVSAAPGRLEITPMEGLL